MKIELSAQEAIELLSNRMSETQFSAVSGKVSEELQKENEGLRHRVFELEGIAKPKPHPLLVKLAAIGHDLIGNPFYIGEGVLLSWCVNDGKSIPITYDELRSLAKELEGV